MTISNKSLSCFIFAIVLASMAAGSITEDTVINIIDNAHPNYTASVSCINMSQESLNSCTKSTVYSNSVYDN